MQCNLRIGTGMRTGLLIASFWLSILFALAQADDLPSDQSWALAPDQTWALGYLKNGELFTMYAISASERSAARPLLWIESIKGSRDRKIYDRFSLLPKDGFLRWRLAFERLWYIWTPAGLNDTQIVCPLSKLGDFEAAPSKPAVETFLTSSEYVWGLDPISLLLHRVYNLRDGEPAPTGVFHDLLPTSPTTGLLFVLEKNRLRTWSCVPIPNEYVKRWSESERETIAVEQFEPEPFQIFGTEEKFHVLLRSGLLFSSEKPKSGARVIRSTWAQGRAPPNVATVIADSDTGKYHVLALGRHGDGNQNGYYFEMGEPAKVTRIDLQLEQLKDWLATSVDKRIRTFLKYLLERKLVTIR